MSDVIAPEIAVTEAGPGDVAEIAAFIWAAWDAADHAAPAFAETTDAWIRKTASVASLKRRLSAGRDPIIMAHAGGALMGVASLRRKDADTIHLAEIVVHPVITHHGVGAPLLEGAIRKAAELGCRTMTAHAEDQENEAFFLHRGFREHDDMAHLERRLTF